MHIKTFLQYLLPHHCLSRTFGYLANSRNTKIKNYLINWFCNRYQIDLSQALEPNIDKYATFNDFFTRRLKANARPLPADPKIIISPIDGTISQIGTLDNQRLIQAKGKHFILQSLLSQNLREYFAAFNNGCFTTLYLSPKDYHRVHIPCAGKLIKTVHIPGRIFSVNPLTANDVDRLYARNERVVAMFETAIGPMAVVFVGAMMVASIKTVWQGIITPPTGKKIRVWEHADQNINFARGDEIGQFQFGSTVIILFPKDVMSWNSELRTENKIQFGQELGSIKTSES